MKPGIVNIIYAVLALLLLGAGMQISVVFSQNTIDGYTALYNSSLSIVVAIAALVSIISLARKLVWSRIVTFLVIGLQSLVTIGLGAFLAARSEDGIAMSVPYLTYGFPMLFLAYKTYSSKPLKEYLESA